MKNRVAAGFHGNDLGGVRRAMRRFEAILQLARLRQRQGAAPRPKSEGESFARSRCGGRNWCVSYLFGSVYRLKINAASGECQILAADDTRERLCRRAMRVLGIETTCDETAAAVVQLQPGESGEILSNEIMSQIAEHAAFGGVVPEIAARAHIEIIDRLVELALDRAGTELADLDGIAAAAGPGLIGGIIVGLTTAKALALASRKPFIAVNHLEAHALTARLAEELGFPFLLLLVSGGHTQLVAVKGVGDYLRLGSTVDDAAGEAFDKVGKMLGLPYPGGPRVEKLAEEGSATRFDLPRPMLGRPKPDFSFSR